MSRAGFALLARTVLLIAPFAVTAPALAAKPVPPDQVDKLHALIKPAKDEDKWATVPWQTSLWEARQLAAEKGKPLLLWEMDGHPLGCT
jgi:hypothetical protein